MSRRVVVTGMGCITPVGNNVKETWHSILAGKSGAAMITHFDASRHKTRFAAEVKGFDPVALLGTREARKMDRFTQFATAVAMEALEQSGVKIDESNRDRVGVMIGTGIGGIGSLLEQVEVMHERGPDRVSPFLVPMMISDSAPGMLAIRFGARGPNMALATACASGNNAIGEALETIRRGAADVMIAGGSEAALVPVAMAGMNVMTALSTRNDDPQTASRPFDKDRDGFLMGEGAGMLILESIDHAQARGANILCELGGYGTTDDAHHISAPAENGAGAAIAMKLALENANLHIKAINYHTPDPECDLDYIPNQPRKVSPKHVMSNSFGFGGHNATVIFSRFEG